MWWWKQRHDPHAEEMKEWASLLDKDREVAEAKKVKGDINKDSIGTSDGQIRGGESGGGVEVIGRRSLM